MSGARLYAVEGRVCIYIVSRSPEDAEQLAVALLRGEIDARVTIDDVDASEATREDVPAEDDGVTPWDSGCIDGVTGVPLDDDELDQPVSWWLARRPS